MTTPDNGVPPIDAAQLDAEVAIVGSGPVGQLLAILLGQRGHRVLVLDKWAEAYPRPRAVQYDDEIARVLAQAGVREQAAAISLVGDSYEWRNGAGETLLRFDFRGVGAAGYPRSNAFAQPDLEAVLAQRIDALPTVRVVRGEEVVDVADTGGRVRLTSRGPAAERHWHAGYVVGADGANSFVRGRMDTSVVDLGFCYDWLIVDVRLHEPRVFDPLNLQICDPQRPTTVVCGGVGRRRWEFMRLPGETVADLETPDRIWQLLAPHGVVPANATIERSVVYTFQARWAERWRDGRLFLAGDAAHLMPPFWGQGLCSGLRDAANLAWKLDLVLRGLAGDSLLDTYASERSAHVQHAIHVSVALGNVICVTDPGAAAARDAGMIAAGAAPERILPPAPPPRLGPGVLHTDADGALPPGVGVAALHARVTVGGVTGLTDDVLGPGFLVTTTADPAGVLDADRLAWLAAIGARVVHVVPAGSPLGHAPGVAVDADGALLAHLAQVGSAAAVVRPDGYLFGSAPRPDGLPALVDELRERLAAPAGKTPGVTVGT